MSHQPLYQVWVTNFEGARAPFGPAMIKEACEAFCMSINQQISLGRERDLRDPEVLKVVSLVGA